MSLDIKSYLKNVQVKGLDFMLIYRGSVETVASSSN